MKIKNENPTEFELLGRHQHKWIIVSNRWHCEVCGKGIGMSSRNLYAQRETSDKIMNA